MLVETVSDRNGRRSVAAAIYHLRNRFDELLALDESPEFNLRRWNKKSQLLVKDIKASRAMLEAMQHEVWHFLSDADIRKRDSGYASSQRNYLRRFLTDLREQESDEKGSEN